ncbi:caseinolytic peptidase B protein homolog [Triplophysa rosa]|uniref:caseinolytic peptidase B protein homolog n=1 Tax=Triplophysa rosa TaxID=992332 RepID=UPI002545BE10|nr:caseinolytic peptidase B protein homolog [Triplophysa rosa]
MFLSAVPTRVLMRRSRSLSPCRALQTGRGEASRFRNLCELEPNRSPLACGSRASRKSVLSERSHAQYHELTGRWRASLEARRSSWATLTVAGRDGASDASSAAGVISAAALAFCLKKDRDGGGTIINAHTDKLVLLECVLMRRSRSLSPCRALQTGRGEASRFRNLCELEPNRSPLACGSRASRKSVLSERSHAQYHELTGRWRASLEARRSSWATLTVAGRDGASDASSAAGVISAAALAFCLKKDRDGGGTIINAHTDNSLSLSLRLLAEGVDPNIRHRLGWTALMVATMNRQHNVVKVLLEAGADPNMGDDFSSVYETAREMSVHSLEVLVSREDEFSNRLSSRASFRGCTPLHYAVLADDLQTVRLLLDAGASPLRKNTLGHAPLAYAKDGEMHNVLKEWETKFLEVQQKREAEERRRFPLERRLKEHIIGQEGAINTVASGKHTQAGFPSKVVNLAYAQNWNIT